MAILAKAPAGKFAPPRRIFAPRRAAPPAEDLGRKRGVGSGPRLWRIRCTDYTLGPVRSLPFAIAVAAGAAFLLSSAVERPHFTDVAPRSKIAYITNNNYTGRKYFQQPICG